MMHTNAMKHEGGCSDLLAQYGPLISGRDLVRCLGYKSAAAFRQALKRGSLPVPVFELPNRKGKFALTSEVVRWFAALEKEVEKQGDLKKGGRQIDK